MVTTPRDERTTAPVDRSKAPGQMTTTLRQPRTLSSDVRRGAIWNMAETMLLRLSSIGITAIVARIMDPRTFGVFAVASTVFIIVSALGNFGVASCLARADLDLDSLAPTMVSVSLLTSAALAAVMVLYARPIAAALGSADAADPVKVMAIAVMLAGIFATPTAQCVREFKQNKIFLGNAIATIPSTAVLLILATSGDGAMAFAWSRVTGQLIAGLVVLFSAGKRYLPGIARGAISILLIFGIPLAAADFVSYVLQNVDYALIGRFLGPVALGTYVLAFNVASWSTTLLGGVMTGVSMPAFSRVKHDPERLQNAMVSGIRVVALIAVPLCTLVVVLAHPLVLTIYGPRWSGSATVIPVLAIYGMIAIVCLYFSSILVALGKTKVILGTQLLWLCTLAVAMWIGVRNFGIVGAAVAHVVVITLLVLPCYVFAVRRAAHVRMSRLVLAVLPIMAAGLMCAAVAGLAAGCCSSPLLALLAGAVFGGTAYLLLVFPQAVPLFRRELHNDSYPPRLAYPQQPVREH
jgi:lipopolysaccharide exporter